MNERDERTKREALIAATVRIYGNAFVLDYEHVINPGRVTVYGSLRPPITPEQVEAAARAAWDVEAPMTNEGRQQFDRIVPAAQELERERVRAAFRAVGIEVGQ